MTRLLRLVRWLARALAGLAAAVLLLAGVPYLLLRLAGSPLPRHMPAWPQVKGFLGSPLSDGAIIHGLADIGWVLWALLALCILIEAAAALTGHPAPRLPILGPVQALAASLLGATLLTALPAGLASAGAATLPAGLAARTVAASPLRRGRSATTAVHTAATAGASRQAAGPYRPRTYRVAAGDDLWSIAERVLGKGDQWRQLYQLNKGKPQPGGGALYSPGLIYPGWVLLLPPPAWHHEPTAPAHPRRPAPAHHSSPPAPAHPAPGQPAPSQHRPPSLHHQPARHGDESLPVAVHLPSEALIGISVALAVTAAVALARIQRRRRFRPRPGLPATSLPAEPPLPEVIIALRRAARPAIPPDGDLSAGEPDGEDPYLDLYQPADADPDTGEPETASSRPGPAARQEPDVIPAPILPETVGEHPRPPAARPPARSPLLPASDPDLDLYATSAGPDADALDPPKANGQPATPSLPTRFPGADTAGLLPPPGRLSLGVRGGNPASLDIAALGGLGLTGPGAADAARAVLATLLTQTPPGQPGPPAEIILPAADAARLLPGQDTTGIPGLSVPASLQDALAQMEAALLRQARTTQADGPDSPPPAGPATTLIATCSSGLSARLRAITEAGRSLGVTAVVLGSWPAGNTCQVAADGLVTTTAPAGQGLEGLRLFHLGGPDATAITGLLREAHGACLPAPSAPDRPPAGAAPAEPLAGPPAGTGHHRPAHVPASTPVPAPSAGSAAGSRSGPGQEAATGPDRLAASSAPSPAPPVRLDLLGPPRITAGGQEVSSGMRKARELLALLAVHRDGISGEAINEALWPGLDPGRATRQRNLALRKTRELLRGATGLGGPMWVLLSAGRYQLDPGLITADVWQFHDALHQARHTTDPGQQLAACQRAVALYRGELAEGAGYEWAEPAAETTRHLALETWATIADLLQARDPAQALAALETAVRHDPYNEFLYQRIMRLQADAGHPDAVRRTLSLLESRLTDLGVTPGTQTRQLAATLLGASGPARSPVGSADP